MRARRSAGLPVRELLVARVVIPDNAERIEDTASHRQILLSAAVWQPSGTPQDARLLDHFVVGELVASQVELGPVGQQIPVVHALAAAIAANDVSNQQVAAEQVMDYQRSRPALAAGRIGGGPVSNIDRVTGIESPRRAYRDLKVFLHHVGHARNPATA